MVENLVEENWRRVLSWLMVLLRIGWVHYAPNLLLKIDLFAQW